MQTIFFARINELLSENYDVIFYQRTKYIDETRERFFPVPYGQDLCEEKSYSALLHKLSTRGLLDGSACMKVMRRELLTENNLTFTPNIFSEDIEWVFRLLPEIKTARVLDYPGYCYRIRQGSISHSVTEKNVKDLAETVMLHATLLRERSMDDKVKKALLGYLSYQYSIVLGLSHNAIKKAERKAFLKKMKEYRWLLHYHASKKTRSAIWQACVAFSIFPFCPRC